ncbi:MAG TPA: hypothetical protein VN937_18745 [Blastocatellia bacterium]|nr:hypothetical protein [Blastocatellia bacterium]
MTIKKAGVIPAALLMLLTIGPQQTPAQDATKNRNATVKGQMKQSGKEVSNAGVGLGTNVKHGRVVRGGKHFGKHMYRAGKHFGKGTGMAAKKTGKAVKNAAKPD